MIEEIRNQLNIALEEYRKAEEKLKAFEEGKKQVRLDDLEDKLYKEKWRNGDQKKAPSALINFWISLNDSSSNDQVLSLPSGVHFLGDSLLYPTKLIIRQAYNDLWNNINSSVESGIFRRYTITGNPGIGKSYFLFYLLYILRCKGATVVFDRQIDKKYIIFTGENVYITFYDDMVESFLNNPTTWYLVDTKPPPYVHAITILVCSPNKAYYKEFRKMLKSTIRYMPIWSWNEIVKCRNLLYTDIIDSELIKYYNHWGGIPRFVLEKAGDPSQDLLLEQAIVSISLEKCLQSVGELDTSEEESITSSFRGQLFEGYVHNLLRNGGEFNIRNLNDNNIVYSKIQLTKRNLKSFQSLSEIDFTVDDYWRPIAKNFPSFDSLIPSVGLFQITIALNHNIKIAALKEYDKVIGNKNSNIFFVVPSSIFNKFIKQKYCIENGKIAENIPLWIQNL
ncbi:7310_t:CDS:2 [Funneliformis mosseae]|uniref:7310_t:CDS:1 n=1 Tax=Funneliformis mosseae TaxID=27381 RepID=A0A9N9ETL5_FUNMO|nr:7310_t:CDS:2 [Funneliformis mosseae]